MKGHEGGVAMPMAVREAKGRMGKHDVSAWGRSLVIHS